MTGDRSRPAVFGADEQSARPIEVGRWVALAEAVLAAEGVRGPAEVSLLFVGEEAIADLNQRFLGRDGPTDVLAFPIDDEPAPAGRFPDSGGAGPGWVPPAPEELPLLLGDVVICPEVAWRHAGEQSAPAAQPGPPAPTGSPARPGSPGPDSASDPDASAYQDELALLVVHGLLHLQGMDHEDEAEAEAMEARERELLGRFHGGHAPTRSRPALPS
ncbi:MAG: rRNA maturation RNase YbeY [Acidimicrobiales bacterium]